MKIIYIKRMEILLIKDVEVKTSLKIMPWCYHEIGFILPIAQETTTEDFSGWRTC